MDAKQQKKAETKEARVYECNAVMRQDGVIRIPDSAALPLGCRWPTRVAITMRVDLDRREVTIAIPNEPEDENAT